MEAIGITDEVDLVHASLAKVVANTRKIDNLGKEPVLADGDGVLE